MSFSVPGRERLFWKGFMCAIGGAPLGLIAMLVIAAGIEQATPTTDLSFSSVVFFLGMCVSLFGLVVLWSACWAQHRDNRLDREERARKAEALIESVDESAEN